MAPNQRSGTPKASMAAWGACEADRGRWRGQSQGPGQWQLGETQGAGSGTGCLTRATSHWAVRSEEETEEG